MLDVDIKKTVVKWLETVVIALNLCPFAKREVINGSIRYSVSDAEDLEALINDLAAELLLLINNDSIETTLLIHPKILQDFSDYSQFLDVADELLIQLKLDGIIQIASFHPDYQFADTQAGDVENYTNKSPYPMLHLLREQSLDVAIESHPDTDLIPSKNIETVEGLGRDHMGALLQASFVRRRLVK